MPRRKGTSARTFLPPQRSFASPTKSCGHKARRLPAAVMPSIRSTSGFASCSISRQTHISSPICTERSDKRTSPPADCSASRRDLSSGSRFRRSSRNQPGSSFLTGSISSVTGTGSMTGRCGCSRDAARGLPSRRQLLDPRETTWLPNIAGSSATSPPGGRPRKRSAS